MSEIPHQIIQAIQADILRLYVLHSRHRVIVYDNGKVELELIWDNQGYKDQYEFYCSALAGHIARENHEKILSNRH